MTASQFWGHINRRMPESIEHVIGVIYGVKERVIPVCSADAIIHAAKEVINGRLHFRVVRELVEVVDEALKSGGHSCLSTMNRFIFEHSTARIHLLQHEK
jgi:hypothetical protein